jgi:hypothetical protein
MILTLGVALLLQQPQSQTAANRKTDSITAAIDKRVQSHIAAEQASRERAKARSAAALRALTPEMIASAFKDRDARDLLLRARRARLIQDSALISYDAKSYQRVSAWMGFGRMTRDRLMFRMEQSGNVRWHRDVGVWMDVTGSRTVLPGIPSEGEKDARHEIRQESGDIVPIPYYPGAEPLWAGQELMRDSVRDDEIIHPLATGSELYYTYATGDSVTFRLADGSVIRIRSLNVRPRKPQWNLVVGSLWFDTRTAQLVRAAYRFAVPMHIDAFVTEQDPHAFDDVPVWVKPMIFPMHAEISAITLEYSLHQTRFWLPKTRTAEGSATASFMRIPFALQQSFTYNSVNAIDSLPKIPLAPSVAPPASLDSAGRVAWRDSVRTARRQAARAHRDSIRDKLIPPSKAQCDTSAVTISAQHVGESRIPIAIRIPCDTAALEHSKDLPPSIFDPGDELFDEASRKALMDEALSLSAQAPFSLRPRMLPRPTVNYGLQLTRYNRVEGLSVGLGVDQELGGGYLANITGRVSTATLVPDMEVSLTRSNLTKAVVFNGYHRLNSASDWGNPLSFGSSVSGLLFGRDDGFYYRSTGVSVGGRSERGAPTELSAFIERDKTADVSTTFGLTSGNDLPNIVASNATFIGGRVRIRGSHGLDPNGFRVFSDLRFEAAHADSLYGRGALDLTVTRGLIRDATFALTVAGGSSMGAVPPQRRWYLGGTQTIRGQRPDTAQSGNAFWMTRGEVGRNIQGSRAIVFSDLGWVGDRNHLGDVGRPMSGVGVGWSLLDGLMRFDLARGLYPAKQVRFSAYLDGVF